jgi:hypothetical protein
VVEWITKIPRIFAGEEEQATGAAAEGNGDGDARKKVVAEEVVVGIDV